MNMNQIAKMAGVSQSTVSRVINGSAGVSDEKRKAVMQLIDDHAFSVRTKQKKKRSIKRSIGLLMLNSTFLNPNILMRKIESIVKSMGSNYSLMIFCGDINWIDIQAKFNRGEISGILIAGFTSDDQSLNALISRVPHAWLNSHFLESGESETLAGNEQAGKIAARYLLEHDVKKPLLLTVNSANPGVVLREQGFNFVMFTRSIEADRLFVMEHVDEKFEYSYNRKVEAHAFKLFDKSNIGQYDGVFCVEDRLTAIFYRYLTMNNIPVPRVISCCREQHYLLGLYPRPATIDMGAEFTAKLAVEELVGIIEGRPLSRDIIVVANARFVPGDE